MPSEKQIEAAAKAMEALALEQGFVPWDEAASVAITAAEQAEPVPAARTGGKEALPDGEVQEVVSDLEYWAERLRDIGQPEGHGALKYAATILSALAPAPEAQQERPAEQVVTEAQAIRDAALEEAARLIEEGYERQRAHLYRRDEKPSKYDMCKHEKYMYEDCEQCAVIAIRALKAAMEARDAE